MREKRRKPPKKRGMGQVMSIQEEKIHLEDGDVNKTETPEIHIRGPPWRHTSASSKTKEKRQNLRRSSDGRILLVRQSNSSGKEETTPLESKRT